MTNFLPTLPPAILERCLAFSEHLYAMKPGTVKFEVSPSHFVFTMNQNPVKNSGDSLPFPPPLPKRKKTPSDLRRNALRKAEFLKRKNSVPQAETKSPCDTVVPTPPSANTTPRNQECAAKVDLKEDSHKETLSETTLMDASPMDVQQYSPPENNTRKISQISEIAKKLDIPPAISPLNSPDKVTEKPLADDEDIAILKFCAINENEATKLSKRFFPQSQFMQVSKKNANHFLFKSDVKIDDIPHIIESMNKTKMLLFKVTSNKKPFTPDQPHHCHQCQELPRQK